MTKTEQIKKLNERIEKLGEYYNDIRENTTLLLKHLKLEVHTKDGNKILEPKKKEKKKHSYRCCEYDENDDD